jgi:hypothetical protein
VVKAEIRHGRDVEIANMRAFADIGATNSTATVIATRGERLVLCRTCISGEDQQPGAFHIEFLSVVEVDSDARITARSAYDLDKIGPAFEELDDRYLTGEAAPYAQTWSVIAGEPARFHRHELPAAAPDPVYIDHRKLVSIEGVDLAESVRAVWDITSGASIHIEAVHRLTELAAVFTYVLNMTSHEGFDGEVSMIMVFAVEGDLISRVEVFDEADLDTAVARFDELHAHAPRLENAASRVEQRFSACFAARDWDAMAKLLSDDILMDDRRHVVNAGVMRGRDAEIASERATADVGVTNMTPTVIAIRGGRLALGRYSIFDGWSGTKVVCVSEINAENQIVARVVFDPDDIDAAIEELDARYLAGEGAVHSHTWMLVTRAYAALNRRQLPETAVDWVNIDHRRLAPIAAGDLGAYLLATWDLSPQSSIRIEAVHRLSKLGAVVTHVIEGTSQQGFNAEWRTIDLSTYEGDKISRSELFDEADLDAALARFDELEQSPPPPDNAATRTWARLADAFNHRDLEGFLALSNPDIRYEDRRRVLRDEYDGSTAQRKAVLAVFETIPSTVQMTAEPIAVRGSRLSLLHVCYRDAGFADRPVTADMMQLVEVSDSGRLDYSVSFDLDDVDAGFEELDARYVAGEAGAHSRTWSAIARICAAFNRHEIPATTPDPVYIDHRPLVSIQTVEMAESIRAVWDVTPDIRMCVQAVHRLSDVGAVVTGVLKGTSPEGYDAEWQMINIFAIEGDQLSRLEVFGEVDLDAALARLEELNPEKRGLENAASRAEDRFFAHTRARNWAAMAEILAGNSSVEDRRRVVNIGVWKGRDVLIANFQALAEEVADATSTAIAIRGEHLALTRICAPNRDLRQGDFSVEMLGIAELDTDNRIAAHVLFDPDDIDAAFAELDARYLAGEAADHSDAWSVIARWYRACNRREPLPSTPDRVNVDHRRGGVFAPGDNTGSIRAAWDLMPDTSCYIEAVHRLTDLAGVVTSVTRGTSEDGFDAEWRQIDMMMVDGDLVNRCEIFDEAYIDAALARFDELYPRASRLENAASRVNERFWTHFAVRDWDAMADLTADNICSDDRRRVVNSGVRHGREAHIADMRVIAEIVVPQNLTTTVIATRGARLALSHIRSSNRVVGPDEISAEVLSIVEIDADNRIAANVGFDIDDIDAAFEELDARYLSGEAAEHARTWSVMTRACAAFNRGELPATTPDSVFVDHRPVLAVDAVDLPSYLRVMWDLTPDIRVDIEAVHRLSELGAVLTHAVNETSPEGFNAEWRGILIYTLEADRIKRCEVFDEADLDAALARFDELSQPAG